MFGERMMQKLCADSSKPVSELMPYESYKKISSNIREKAVSFIEKDSGDSIVNGEKKKFNRLYVRDVDRADDGVGWVLNCEQTKCMLCGDEFGYLCWPHHCRACGNIICDSCCNGTVLIVEFPELKEQRACKQCHWDQQIVNATNIRGRSGSEAAYTSLKHATPKSPNTSVRRHMSEVVIQDPKLVKQLEEIRQAEVAAAAEKQRAEDEAAAHESKRQEEEEARLAEEVAAAKLAAQRAAKREAEDRERAQRQQQEEEAAAAEIERKKQLRAQAKERAEREASDAATKAAQLAVLEEAERQEAEAEAQRLAKVEAEREAERKRAEAQRQKEEEEERQVAAALAERLRVERLAAETQRREEEAEQARMREEARLAEEARAAEEARLEEEARLAEEARAAEEARLEEEARLAEEARAAEEARLVEARAAEEARLEEEARLAEEERLEEEARAEEEARRVEEACSAKASQDAATAAREAKETRLLEEAMIAEQEARLTAAIEADFLSSSAEAEAEVAAAKAAKTTPKASVTSKVVPSVSRNLGPFTPSPSFVMKTKVASGKGKVLVNICAHDAVSDVVSAQGVKGCPFMVITRGSASSGDLSVHNVIFHSKYVGSAVNDINGASAKLCSYIVDYFNATDYASNRLSSEVSFPNIKNNYKAGASGEVEPFSLPADMPPHHIFEDITVSPTPVVSLKTKRLNNGQKVFVNLVEHDDIPCSFDPSRPFLFLTNEATFAANDDEESLIFDVAFHPSLWTANQDEVAGRSILLVQERVGDELDKGYKTPKTRNNYKCPDTVFLVASALISGEDVAKTKLVDGSFEGDVTVSSKVFTSAAAKLEASSRQTSTDSVGTVPSRRSSSAAAPVAVPSVTSPVTPAVTTPHHKEHEVWKSFLTAGEEIVATQLVVKPNPYGLAHKRQLILTSSPRLIYVDPSKMVVRGEVEWTKADPPTIYAVSKDTFEIVVSKRSYKFIDKTNGAEFWVKHVQAAIQ